MKTIGMAVVSLVAAFIGHASAGELPDFALLETERHVERLALETDRLAPSAANFASMESSDSAGLRLGCWQFTGASPESRAREAVAQYLEYVPSDHRNAFSPAKRAAILSHTPSVPTPMVRSIEVQSESANERAKAKILANLRTRVGRHYSEKFIEEDTRNLTETGDYASVRIFGVPFANGVKVIVVLKTESDIKADSMLQGGGFNFNIGYQF